MLQVVGSDPGGAWLGCKRFCGRKRARTYFCSRCRIFRAHLFESETYVCPFHLNFCSVLNFWTYWYFSVYALLLPFCSSRSAPAPALLLAAIFRGRAQRARAPIALVCFIIRGRAQGLEPLLLLYVLLLLLLLLLLLYSSNGSLWQPYEGNMGKWWNLAHL